MTSETQTTFHRSGIEFDTTELTKLLAENDNDARKSLPHQGKDFVEDEKTLRWFFSDSAIGHTIDLPQPHPKSVEYGLIVHTEKGWVMPRFNTAAWLERIHIKAVDESSIDGKRAVKWEAQQGHGNRVHIVVGVPEEVLKGWERSLTTKVSCFEVPRDGGEDGQVPLKSLKGSCGVGDDPFELYDPEISPPE